MTGTGAGSVTCGAAFLNVSVNCTLKPVTARPVAPFGLTTTTNGTLNGATCGQRGLLTGWAKTVDDCTPNVTAVRPEGSRPNEIGSVGYFFSQDAEATAAPRRRTHAMCRQRPSVPRSRSAGMGSLLGPI